jgi:endonuclease YncB( thermonuclease family)
MAKTATRRRKAPTRSRAGARSGGGGSALPWAIIGVMAVGGIAVYDNWKSVKPLLASHAPSPAVSRPVTVARSEPARERDPGPKQTASIASVSKIIPPAAVPIPASKAPVVAEKAIPVSISPVSISPGQTQAAKAAFGYCGQGEHINCVADGGTFWYKGEKIVIADIVSPGIDAARCDGERRAGFAAKLRLLNLLNAGSFSMNAAGQPGKDGAPRVVSRDGRSIGGQLVDEGLARKPGKGAWCA